MNLWAKNTDIVYEDLSNDGESIEQHFHETTKQINFKCKWDPILRVFGPILSHE